MLSQQANLSAKSVEQASGDLTVILCPGNRSNQEFFKRYNTDPEKPWLTVDGIYLLFYYEHLLKNIRNLWLTEKTGELAYEEDGIKFVSKWQHLRDLFKFESSKLVKMSNLTEVAAYPRPIERQRVDTRLKIFSAKTATALKIYGADHNVDVKGTVMSLENVSTWWTILNVKQKGIDVRNREPLQAV